MNVSNIISIVKGVADFVYCYKNHKEINDAEKESCVQFLDYLNISFDESKAAEALKSVIYDRLKTDKSDLAKGDKGKTYRNMVNYFENKTNSKGESCKFSFPSRDSLIQICLDFDICDKDRINWLFDKMYYDRLYLKDGRDFVIYCYLTKPTIRAEIEAAYPSEKDCLDCVDAFIKDEKINAKRIHIKDGFDNGASKFTSEIYDEIEDDDRFYVYDLPAELLNTISEEVEEPIYSYKSSYSYTPSYSYRNNQNRRGGMMLC